jgi:hypothetical protein
MNEHIFPNISIKLERSYKAYCVICGKRGISVYNKDRKGSLCGNCKYLIQVKIAIKNIKYSYKKYKNRII